MTVTATFFKTISKNKHCFLNPPLLPLTTLWISILLIFPSVASTTNIDAARNIQPLSEMTAGNRQPPASSSAILDFYNTLFIQTWEQAPDIQIAKKLQEQKSAEKYTAWAKRLAPQLNLEISQKQFLNKNFPSADDQSFPSEITDENDYYTDGRDVTDWEFDLDIPLYRRALAVSLDISQLEYDLAVNNLEIKTRELDSILHELLSNYMVACYNLLNLKNSILISQEHVAKIQRGFDLRDQTKLALLRAQANLKELEAREDLNEQRRDTAFRELLDYTAIPEQNPTWLRLGELLDTEKHTAECINRFSTLETGTEKMRPFLEDSATDEQLQNFFVDHSLLYKKIILERNLGETKSSQHTQGEWPAFFVRGEFDRKPDTRFSDYSGEGSIGLVLSVPLFSGGTVFSNIKTRDMASRIASIQGHTDTLRTYNSIANKKKTITSLQSIFRKQQIHLQQQEEIVRLSLKSYQIKQTSMQDLLTSKNRLIDAKNLLMRTTADLGILLRQFAWELGTPFPAPSIDFENKF
ncbi:MAG TPA: TolC family protein [Desulfobacterales bacterium]|nr:TolC family protein [Desulfobacterales bacterium]